MFVLQYQLFAKQSFLLDLHIRSTSINEVQLIAVDCQRNFRLGASDVINDVVVESVSETVTPNKNKNGVIESILMDEEMALGNNASFRIL